MFMLRRSAARALSAPTKTFLSSKPRSITTFTPTPFRSRQQQQWIVPALQKRFVSNETAQTSQVEDVTAEDKAAVDIAVQAAEEGKTATEEFAQTAAEAPVDETLSPVAENTVTSAAGDATAAGAAAGHAAQSAQGVQTRFAAPVVPPNNTLYVGNLFFEVTEEQLQRVFSRFGTVEEVKIITDPQGRSRGFAYVRFENLADATAAQENLDMQVFEGRNMVVQYHKARNNLPRRPAFERPQSPPSKTLYIGNMSFQMTDRDLNDLFKTVRNVLDVRVAIDRRTGQPRGFAHADFLDVESATKALQQLNGKSIYGRNLRIDFSRTGTYTSARQNENEPAQQ